MREVIGLLALNLGFLLAGYGVLSVLRRPTPLADAGVAFLIGAATVLLASCLLAVAGYVSGIPVFLVLAAAASAPLARRLPALRRPVIPLRRPARPSLAQSVTLLLGGCAAAYAVALLVVASVKFLDEWDAWSMWTMKAKALVVFGNLGVADFVGQSHPDYPILVPMLQSYVFRFVDAWDTQVVHVEHALLAIAFAVAVPRLLRARLAPTVGAAIALFLLVVPGVDRNVPDALADVPVAIFVALAALALGSWLVERDTSWLALFVLFGAAATWTKDEGAASVAAMCVAAAPFAFRRPLRRSLGPFAAAAAVIVVLFLPWREWKSAHGAVYDTNLAQGLNFHFLGTRRHAAASAFHAMWSQLANVHIWFALPYLFVLVVVAAFLLRRGRALAVFSLLAPALAFLVYVWVYAIRTDPLGLSWTLDTTVTRVVTSVGLMVSALLALQISVLDEPAPATRTSETTAAAPEAVAG